VQVKIREVSLEVMSDYGGKDLWKRWVLSLEWKVEGVTDGENEGDGCDEVIYAGWGEPGGEWTQWGWRNEEGSFVQPSQAPQFKITNK